MKTWMEFQHGMPIGPRDQNGKKLHFGDKVTIKIPEKIIEGTIMYFPQEAAFLVSEDGSSQVWRIDEQIIYKKE